MQPSHLDISELWYSSARTSINFGPINFPPPVCFSLQISQPRAVHLALSAATSAWACSPASTLHPPPPASAPAQPSHHLLLLNPSSSCSTTGIHPHALPMDHHLIPVHPAQSSGAGPEMTWLSLLLSSPFSKCTLQDWNSIFWNGLWKSWCAWSSHLQSPSCDELDHTTSHWEKQ